METGGICGYSIANYRGGASERGCIIRGTDG